MPFTIPASTKGVVAKLDVTSRLITAQEWERAALLASVVRLGEGQGTSSSSGRGFESAREFAKRGIHGLRSTSTVTRYVSAWLDTHNGKYPALGATVKIPTTEFPTTERGQNQGPHISSDAKTAVDQVIAQHGPAAVAAAIASKPRVLGQVAKKADTSVLADAIQAAGSGHEDNVFHELAQRRAGIDTSKANRKAADAFADSMVKPFKQSFASMKRDLVISALEEATKDLREIVSEGVFDRKLDGQIQKALDEFQAVRAEGVFAIS